MGITNRRLNQIIEYLQAHEMVSTNELMEYLSKDRKSGEEQKPLKKSTLSEDIKKLTEQGYSFNRKRGYISLANSSQKLYQQITLSDLCRAEVILALFHKGFNAEMSLEDFQSLLYSESRSKIKKRLDPEKPKPLTSSLRALLKKMVAENILSERKAADKKLMYSLKDMTFAVRYFDQGRLKKLQNMLKTEGVVQSYYPELASLSSVLDILLPMEPQQSEQELLIHGKQNILNDKTRENLYFLNQLPYARKSIHFTQQTKKNVIAYKDFCIGLLIYSIEKNQIYILGESNTYTHKCVIPIDQVSNFVCGEMDNPHFKSAEYQQIKNEMIFVSIENPVHVSVRFRNRKYIAERVWKMQKNREATASIQPVSPEEIRYEDTIRGIYDFARFLRGFGPYAIVEEPECLREIMIESAKKTLNLYKEAPDEQS